MKLAGFSLAWLVTGGALVACSWLARPASAEATYGAALLKCVDDAKTLAESKACRARVDAAWGVDGGAR